MFCPTEVNLMNSVQDIWNAILKILSNTLTPTAIQTWFSDCKPIEWSNGTMVLWVRNEFTQNILLTRFGSVIKASASCRSGPSCRWCPA